MHIATFYTKDTPYENIVVEYLLESCKKQALPTPTVVGIDSMGSWQRNVAEKPRIIRELLEKHDKLVFLDADATVEQYPKLFDEIPEQYDIAFHTLNWNEFYGYKQTGTVLELLSGTMYFRNRPKVKTLCDAWYEKAVKSSMWEQKVLQEIIKDFKLKTYALPIEYCAIVRSKNFLNLSPIKNPVILHHQKSREMKRAIR